MWASYDSLLYKNKAQFKNSSKALNLYQAKKLFVHIENFICKIKLDNNKFVQDFL